MACGVQDIQLNSLRVSSLQSYECLSWDPTISYRYTCVKNNDNLYVMETPMWTVDPFHSQERVLKSRKYTEA